MSFCMLGGFGSLKVCGRGKKFALPDSRWLSISQAPQPSRPGPLLKDSKASLPISLPLSPITCILPVFFSQTFLNALVMHM